MIMSTAIIRLLRSRRFKRLTKNLGYLEILGQKISRLVFLNLVQTHQNL